MVLTTRQRRRARELSLATLRLRADQGYGARSAGGRLQLEVPARHPPLAQLARGARRHRGHGASRPTPRPKGIAYLGENRRPLQPGIDGCREPVSHGLRDRQVEPLLEPQPVAGGVDLEEDDLTVVVSGQVERTE